MHVSKVDVFSVICLMSVTMVTAQYYFDDRFDSDWNDDYGVGWFGGSTFQQRGGNVGWSGRTSRVQTGGPIGGGFRNQYYNRYLFGDSDDNYYVGGGFYGCCNRMCWNRLSRNYACCCSD